MGYIIGYREIYYSGKTSYTAEAIFRSYDSDYLYFALDDFTGSQTSSNTYGILYNGILSDNILGVIPLNGGMNGVTFDNNANFIYKKREYFGPVNISRIKIQVLNQIGDEVDFRETDFSFAIQVKTIYNLVKKSEPNLRNVGVNKKIKKKKLK